MAGALPAGEIAGSDAVGTAMYWELYQRVDDLIKSTSKKSSSPHLEEIKATLDSLSPRIKHIEDRNKGLNLWIAQLNKLKRKLSDGTKLVEDCSNNPKWYRKTEYTQKLANLDKSLRRVLLNSNFQSAKEKTSIMLKEIKKAINLSVSLWLSLAVIISFVLGLMIVFSGTSGQKNQFSPKGEVTLLPTWIWLLQFSCNLVVWTIAKALVYIAYSCYCFLVVSMALAIKEYFRDLLRRGFSWSEAFKLLNSDPREWFYMTVGFCMLPISFVCCWVLTGWINQRI